MSAAYFPPKTQALLKWKYYRFITRARRIARQQIRRDGTTWTRKVRREMKQQGLLEKRIPEYWLGVVFRHRDFKWTGEFHIYGDRKRNIHKGTIKIWTFR